MWGPNDGTGNNGVGRKMELVTDLVLELETVMEQVRKEAEESN